ncbi:MAG: carbohydrate kinase [Clostridia bacterium]|nr:carbohydrate kinase [Clostridia bacterium]
MKIVTIGELLVDLTQTGEVDGVPQYSANPGGAPANVAVAASLMGSDTAFVGKVGNDSFGNMLIKTLQDKKVDVSGIVKSDEYKTTLAVVSLDGNGERSFSFYRKNCADVNLTFDEIDVDLIKSADVLHFGSVSLTDEPCFTAIESAVKIAKSKGAIITYDPNYRPLLWKNKDEAVAKMRYLLKFVDIIKVSDEELFLLTDERDLQKGAELLLSEGIKIVLVTLGENGAFLKTRDCQGKIDARKVTVADTNGAGDTFFGAFLSQIDFLENFEKNNSNCLYNAVKFACTAAEISVTKSGAIPAMPSKNEVEKIIKKSL